MHQTSGTLKYSEAKGLHCVTAPWWIDTCLDLGHAVLPIWPRTGLSYRLPKFLNDEPARIDYRWRLFVYPGYLLDGSSGPTVDGMADPVPSLVHDVLYEMMRTGNLGLRGRRDEVDALYRDMLIERGMGPARAYARWAGLRLIGWVACRRKPEHPARSAR